MKKLLLIFFILLFLCGTSNAEYFSDIIVTSPDGIWTDSRTYSTLNDAVDAVGVNKRTIVIANQKVVTSLTIPSNITLKFERDGSIANSGQLTINTKDIISDNHQIFTGTGNIDFASGSIIKSSWFSNVETAFALTSNDTLTLIISKPQIITASYSPGNNVHLQWEAPGNILTVSAGVTVGNLGRITAGDYQIFAGAGDFDFNDGTNLKTSWFNSVRSALTWIESEKVTLSVVGTVNLDFPISVTSNVILDFTSNHGKITFDPGIVLTVSQRELPLSGFENLDVFINNISSTGLTVVISEDVNVIADTIIPKEIILKPIPGAILSIVNSILTINSPFNPGLHQVFSCTGTGKVVFGSGSVTEIYPQWWGVVGDGITDNLVGWQKFLSTINGRTAKIPNGIYRLSNGVVGSIYKISNCIINIEPGAQINIDGWTGNTVGLQIGSNVTIHGTLKIVSAGSVSDNGAINVPICIGDWWDGATSVNNVNIDSLVLSQGDDLANLLIIIGNVHTVNIGSVIAEGTYSCAVMAHWVGVPNSITPTISYHPHGIYIGNIIGDNAKTSLCTLSAVYDITIGSLSGDGNYRGLFSIGGDFGNYYAPPEQTKFICKGIRIKNIFLSKVKYRAIYVNASSGSIITEMEGQIYIEGGSVLGDIGSNAGVYLSGQYNGKINLEIAEFGENGIVLRDCRGIDGSKIYAHDNGYAGINLNGTNDEQVIGCDFSGSFACNNNQALVAGMGNINVNQYAHNNNLTGCVVSTNNGATHGVTLGNGSTNNIVVGIKGTGFSGIRYVVNDLNSNTTTNIVREITSDGITFYTGPPMGFCRSPYGQRLVFSDAAPIAGVWIKGDIIFSTLPAGEGYVGWVCVLGGTPGTWKGFGLIQP